MVDKVGVEAPSRSALKVVSLAAMSTALAILLVIVFQSPARAATFEVTNTNDSGAGSLRQAISDANANQFSDRIVFNLPGSGPHTIQLNGELQVNSSVEIAGPTDESVAVRGNGSSQVFWFRGGSGVSASVSNLTITNGGNPDRFGAQSMGGGILNGERFASNGVNLTVMNSTIVGNRAEVSGGGIFNRGGSLRLVNVTVANNATNAFDGGGVRLFDTDHVSITNSTITGNSAPDSGGGISKSGFFQPLTLHNSVVAGNTAGNGPDLQVSTGVFASFDTRNNFIGNGSGTGGYSSSDQVGTNEAPLDPDLGPLQDNGGPTQTRLPYADSPLIDRGSNTLCPITDQRGVERPRDGDGNLSYDCDIGSVEAAGPLPPFTVQSVSPASATQGDDVNLAIEGTGFEAGTKVSLKRGSTVLRASSVSFGPTNTDRLTASFSIPEDFSTGKYDLEIVTPDGTGQTFPERFEVISLPRISSVSPASGIQGETVSLSLGGSGFGNDATVRLVNGSDTISATSVNRTSSEQLSGQFSLPSNASAGKYDVVVTSGGKTATRASAFEVVARLSVSSVSPGKGHQGDALALTVSGAGIQEGARVSLIQGSSTIRPSSTSGSGASLTAEFSVPDDARPGRYEVEVRNPDAQTASVADAFEVVALPRVSSVSPSSGFPNRTLDVAVNGSGFVDGATVALVKGSERIDASSATFGSSGRLAAEITLPETAPGGLWDVEVANPDGKTATLAEGFEVGARAPTLGSVSPGTALRGDTMDMLLTGSGFQDGARVNLSLGSLKIWADEVNVNSAEEVVARVAIPEDAPAGSYDVEIVNSDTQSATRAGAFDLARVLSTNLDLSVSHAPVFPNPAVLSGRLFDSGGNGVGGKEIIVERKLAGSSDAFQTFTTLTTEQNGTFRVSVQNRSNTVYRAYFAGDREANLRQSESFQQANVRVRIATSLSKRTIKRGQNVVVAGTVQPARNGVVEIRVVKAGKVVLTRNVRLNEGRYRFSYRPVRPGWHAVVVRFAGDQKNTGNLDAPRRFVVKR